jgi:hypothetical protein
MHDDEHTFDSDDSRSDLERIFTYLGVDGIEDAMDAIKQMANDQVDCNTTVDLYVKQSQRVTDLETENCQLRGIIARAKLPCIYCGLTDMAQCSFGFPGCGRMDDIMMTLTEDEMSKSPDDPENGSAKD